MDRIQKGVIIWVLLLLIFSVVIVSAESLSSMENINKVEKMIYGTPLKDKPLIERIEKVEHLLFESSGKGSLTKRVERINSYITTQNKSLVLLLNINELILYNQIKDNNILERLNSIENDLFGEKRQGPIVQRIEKASNLIQPSEENIIKKVTVPAGSEFKVRLVNELDSSRVKKGQMAEFEIVADVNIDKAMVIPAGTRGTIEIGSVEKAGKFGKNADIHFKKGIIRAIDGQNINIQLLTEEDEDFSRETAAGLSILGAVTVSHPVGLIAGYFYEGNDIKIPEGTIIKMQTVKEEEIDGYNKDF
ncbi:MAG: hypothetical protein ACOCZT_01415 [Halanaerobiales bacterium]